MKNILYKTLAILLIFSTFSCAEDFLDVESADKLFIDSYYNTEDRIFEALVAAYDPLTWFDYAWGQYTPLGMVSDVMADDVYVGGSSKDDCPYLHKMSNYEALPTSVVTDLWTTFYSGINRSNIVLQYIDGVAGISEANKSHYIAEAKVLRSFYYTWLWKLWGNIPYYEKNLEFPYIQEQSTADQVYENIIATLEDAIENGGLEMR
ncbi:MAG: RagB/SusD family nutrient uptake outer membrane protein, partial [Bacteroidales bacterium]|nr:RagB/SusD family nutrient uptake outer membrane protein [Bacteroidales bacterium]